MKKTLECKSDRHNLKGRVLARIVAEDLKQVAGAETKSKSCGWGCDEIVTDCWKLYDDQY